MSTNSKIIGFAGRAGSGKSTCAEYLESLGFKKVAYADKLKQAVSVIFDIPMSTLTGDLEVKSQVDPFWGMSYRQILQKFGTEAFRKTFGPDIWEKALWREYDHPKQRPLPGLVIEDVRFPNESEAILQRGGLVIEVCRSRCAPEKSFWRRDHASEKPLPERLVSARIANHTTVEDMLRQLRRIMYEKA